MPNVTFSQSIIDTQYWCVMTKQISLTQNKVALVSDHRFKYLNQWGWHAYRSRAGKWYAKRTEGWPFQKTILMHRQIMGITDPKIEVDHRDNDGLNNVDDNLRVATKAQNMRNRGKNKNNTSGYKGVYWYLGKWQASINVNHKTIYLGRFSDIEDAACAYDEAARKYHGEYANLNNVGGNTRQ